MRKYKRKPGRVNPDRRMARAVELRGEGLSNYQIAERLSCSEGTVRNDLARWERERVNVAPLVRKTTAQKSPPGGGNYAADYAGESSNVVAISDRRKQA